MKVISNKEDKQLDSSLQKTPLEEPPSIPSLVEPDSSPVAYPAWNDPVKDSLAKSQNNEQAPRWNKALYRSLFYGFSFSLLTMIYLRGSFYPKPRPPLVETTVDYLFTDSIKSILTKSQSPYVFCIALNEDQEIVAHLKKQDNKVVPYLTNSQVLNGGLPGIFPAASLFKIITSIAALETKQMADTSLLPLMGARHTLYKRQLFHKNPLTPSSLSTNIPFALAFAQSINPIFGKIGIYALGPQLLEETAQHLYFNKELPTDFPLVSSSIHMSQDPFRVAEIASGYNRETKVSLVHAAYLVSTILNGGLDYPIHLYKHSRDFEPEEISKNHPRLFSERTSQSLRGFFRETILRGTSRKAFRKILRDSSDLEIGAKTGSIDGKEPPGRYDWWVGYGADPSTGKKLILSILSIHQKVIGLRSSQIASQVISAYFHRPLSNSRTHHATSRSRSSQRSS